MWTEKTRWTYNDYDDAPRYQTSKEPFVSQRTVDKYELETGEKGEMMHFI